MPVTITVSERRHGARAVRNGPDYEYEREFIVKADAEITEKEARDADGIPAWGDSHPESSGARLDGKVAESLDRLGRTFIVRASYRSRSASNSDQGDTPELWTPQIDFYRVGSREAIDTAQYLGTNGSNEIEPTTLPPNQQIVKHIATTAGELYEPIEVDIGRLAMSYSRWEASFNPNNAADYMDAINADAWSIPGASPTTFAQPHTAKLTDWRASRRYQQGRLLYWVTYEFLFGAHHNIVLLDAGYFERVTFGEGLDARLELRRMPDADKQPTTVPQMLGGNGEKLAIVPDAMTGEPTNLAPYWNHYRHLRLRNFSSLGLD